MLVCFFAGLAESATLIWAPSPEADVAGYVVSYGTTPRRYTMAIDAGNTTMFNLTPPEPTQVYYVAVQAYNTAGVTSPYSNEVATAPVTFTESPLTVTSVVADMGSPQPLGTTITFAATATGGSARYQYKWWVVDGNTVRIGQDWSTSNTFAWKPKWANADYGVTVWVRDASSTVDNFDNPAAKLTITFSITQRSRGPRKFTGTPDGGATAAIADTSVPFGAAHLAVARASGTAEFTDSARDIAQTRPRLHEAFQRRWASLRWAPPAAASSMRTASRPTSRIISEDSA